MVQANCELDLGRTMNSETKQRSIVTAQLNLTQVGRDFKMGWTTHHPYSSQNPILSPPTRIWDDAAETIIQGLLSTNKYEELIDA